METEIFGEDRLPLPSLIRDTAKSSFPLTLCHKPVTTAVRSVRQGFVLVSRQYYALRCRSRNSTAKRRSNIRTVLHSEERSCTAYARTGRLRTVSANVNWYKYGPLSPPSTHFRHQHIPTILIKPSQHLSNV